LKYIVEYLSDGIHDDQDNSSIVFYRKGNQTFYFSTEDISILLQTDISEPKKLFDTKNIRSSAIAIFLSNVFDPTPYYAYDHLQKQLGKTKNLSTQYLLYADYQNRTGQDAFRNNLTYEQRFSAFAKEEMIRMVRLLRWI